MNKLPIGIFDSGLGGLTLVREIRKILPKEDIVYLGDTARIPYGTRSRETVVKFALEDTAFLEKKGVKCIAIACNTASALALMEVRKKTNLKVFDVITGGAFEAVKASKNKKIGVIGTRGTIGSKAYEKMIKKLDPGIEVFSAATPLLVPFIEEGELEGPRVESLLNEYLAPLKKKGIDTLILGCTHYPLLMKVLSRNFKNINLINPSVRLALTLESFLLQNKLQRLVGKAKVKYYVTDMTDRFVKTAEMFLGERIVGKIGKAVVD